MRKEESLAAFAARTRLEIGGLGVPKGAFELVKDRGIYLFTPPSRQEGRKQSRRYSRLVAKKRKESQLPSSSSSLLNIDPFTFHTLTCDQALKTAENKFLRTPGRRRLAKRRGLCDSELFELLPPGDRPDTIVVRGIPVRWFVLSAKVEAYNRRKRERSTLRRDCDGVNNGKQEDAVRKSGIGRAQEVPMKRKGEHENAENRMAYESFDGEKEIAVKSAMYRGQGNNEEDGDGEYGVEGKEEGELEEEEEEKYDVDDALYHFARGKDGPGVERVIEMFERFGELAFFTKIIEVRGARESKFSKAKRERRKIPRLSILCSMDSASLSGEEARMNMTFDVVSCSLYLCFQRVLRPLTHYPSFPLFFSVSNYRSFSLNPYSLLPSMKRSVQVVQFHQYSGFLAACRSLFGSQILAVSPGSSSESIPCLVEIDLEGYFTKESINRREVQEKMEQDREKALRGAEQKRRNQILRTLRSKMIAIDKGVESSKEDFAIMIDKVSALEKEAVQYKNGEGIVKELIELTIEPLEQLLVKVEDKRADGVWMRDQLMGKGEGADNSKVGGGAGSDVSLEGYQACITAYGKLQRLYKKSMGRAERAVDETLSDFRYAQVIQSSRFPPLFSTSSHN